MTIHTQSAHNTSHPGTLSCPPYLCMTVVGDDDDLIVMILLLNDDDVEDDDVVDDDVGLQHSSMRLICVL